MAGRSVRFKDRKDRKKNFKRSTDSAQKGSEKKDRDDTDDEAERKEGKGTPKLKFNRADVLEYCKEFDRKLRTQQPKEYIPLLKQIPESVREVLMTWMPSLEQPKWVEAQRVWHENENEERRSKGLKPKKAPEIRTEFELWTYDNLIEYTPELWGQDIAVIMADVGLKRFIMEYDKLLIEKLRDFFGAHDPYEVMNELKKVKLTITDSVLLDIGNFVQQIKEALKGLQLPEDESALVKAVLQGIEKVAPHLYGAFKVDAAWMPTSIAELNESLLNMARAQHQSAVYFTDWNKSGGCSKQEKIKLEQQLASKEKRIQELERQLAANKTGQSATPRSTAADKENRPVKCYNCQGFGHKAPDCPKEGGGAHTGPQQPGATKKRLFQTAAVQLKGQMESVDKLVSAMQKQGENVEKLMEAIARK
jgi:hypothetical protein